MSAPNEGKRKISCGGTEGVPSTLEERRAARASIYRRLFGPALEVIEGSEDESPRIDLHVFGPGHAGREFYTVVTSGMSDEPMIAPDEFAREVRRAEIVIYVDQPGDSIFELLRVLARLPFSHRAWVGHGHSIPNGDPPSPLFPGSNLVAVLMLRSNVHPEKDMHHVVEIDGDPLNMLWPVLLTAGELDLKVREGTDALIDVFNEKRFSFVLDPGRSSLVGSRDADG
jgi:hypothetical protein